MEKNYIMISTTFDNKEEAETVAKILLDKRLVSCCQFSSIKSMYHWKGNIEESDEILLQMKSKKKLYKKIESIILENHSYETPQIIASDIDVGLETYLKWIEEETI